jgi:hypothetical protein
MMKLFTLVRALPILTLILITAPALFADESKSLTPTDRSALLVVKGFSGESTYFSGLIGPKISARASSTGISVSPIELKQSTQKEMINEARGRGADFLIDIDVAHFSSTNVDILGQKQRRMSASLSWRIIDISGANSAVASGETKDANLGDQILADTEQSASLADSIASKVGQEIAHALKESNAKVIKEVSVPIVIIADELSFPAVAVGKDYVLQVSKESLQVKLSGFTILVDGIVVGTTDDGVPVNLPIGLHDISLERNGFTEWKQRVKVSPGLSLRPVIRPTAQSIITWREQVKFIQDLTDGAKLTDAQVELINAKAQELRNSGYRVDIKVDAKALPETVIYPTPR